MLELKNNECMSEQQELNNFIASELDTHQIILEYGRVLLDNDKEIRDKYKWITSIVSNRSLSISALLEFILPFIGIESVTSHFSLTSLPTPLPSEPITSAIAPFKLLL